MKRLWPRLRYRLAEVNDAERPIVDQVVSQVGKGTSPVMVVGLERLAFPGAEKLGMWQNLNITRPRWGRELPRTVVFWVTSAAHRLLAQRSPDLYRFRSITIDLAVPKSLEEERITELFAQLDALNLSPSTKLQWLTEIWRATGDDASLIEALKAACQGGGEVAPDIAAKLGQLSDVTLAMKNPHDLSPLRHLKNADKLTLVFRPYISDISVLSSLDQIRELALSGVILTRMNHIAPLKKLSLLFVSNSWILDVSSLAQLRNLRAVVFRKSNIAGINSLASLPRLSYLDLQNTSDWTDSNFEHISSFAKCKNLDEVILPNGMKWNPQEGPPPAPYT